MEALKYAGGEAASAGMDLQQTTAILGMFGDTGLKGSAAGTTFVSMLNDMKKNADDGAIAVGDMSIALYDAEGNMRDLGTIMTEVETATDGMSGATRDAALSNIFGVEAMKGVNSILAQGTDRYRELEEATYNSAGAAEEMADTMEDNIGGAFRAMWSAIEGLMIAIGDHLKPYIQDAADVIGRFATKFSEMSDGAQRFIIIGGAIAAAIGPMLLAFGWLMSFIPKVAAGFKLLSAIKLGSFIPAITGAISATWAFTAALLANPITWIIVGIVALIAVIVLLWQNWDQVSQWLSDSWDWLLGAATSAFSAIGEFISGVWNSIVEWTVSTWNSVVDTVQERMNAAKQWVIEIWNEAQAFLEGIDLFQVGKDIIQGLINGIGDMAGKLWGKVTEIAGGIKDAITGFWRTASPSKLAIEIGGDIGEGLSIGLDDSIVDVSSSALDLAETANLESFSPGKSMAHRTNNSSVINHNTFQFDVNGDVNDSTIDKLERRMREVVEREFPDQMNWYNKRMRAKMV